MSGYATDTKQIMTKIHFNQDTMHGPSYKGQVSITMNKCVRPSVERLSNHNIID